MGRLLYCKFPGPFSQYNSGRYYEVQNCSNGLPLISKFRPSSLLNDESVHYCYFFSHHTKLVLRKVHREVGRHAANLWIRWIAKLRTWRPISLFCMTIKCYSLTLLFKRSIWATCRCKMTKLMNESENRMLICNSEFKSRNNVPFRSRSLRFCGVQVWFQLKLSLWSKNL